MTIRRDFSRVLLAEWTKFRTLRSTIWTLAASAVVTVALGISLLPSIVDRYDAMPPAKRATLDPVGTGIWYHGLHLGQVIVAVLGVLLVTSEYSTGTIRATLAATPNRGRVLAAKTLGFGGVAVIFGGIIAFIMFAVAQPMLATRGLDVPVTAPAALRGVGLAALATAGVALLGLAAGVLIRHTAGALTTLLIVLLGIPIVGQFFPASWQTVARYLPHEAGWAMFTPSGDSLPIAATTAVFAGWVATVLIAATAAFHRRDA
jgi:ABC-type transport system involved in multi-copper enzyme maturation permease subunit